jgi:hypothetical protein
MDDPFVLKTFAAMSDSLLVVKLAPYLHTYNRRLFAKACNQATQQLTPTNNVQQDDGGC